MAKAYKKRVLGRGLSAILSDNDNNRFSENRVDSISKISIDDIKLNPNQPRTNFDQKAIEELASSIKELGLIQPITIQKNNDSYELISGERRLRAFKFLKFLLASRMWNLLISSKAFQRVFDRNIRRRCSREHASRTLELAQVLPSPARRREVHEGAPRRLRRGPRPWQPLGRQLRGLGRARRGVPDKE